MILANLLEIMYRYKDFLTKKIVVITFKRYDSLK